MGQFKDLESRSALLIFIAIAVIFFGHICNMPPHKSSAICPPTNYPCPDLRQMLRAIFLSSNRQKTQNDKYSHFSNLWKNSPKSTKYNVFFLFPVWTQWSTPVAAESFEGEKMKLYCCQHGFFLEVVLLQGFCKVDGLCAWGLVSKSYKKSRKKGSKRELTTTTGRKRRRQRNIGKLLVTGCSQYWNTRNWKDLFNQGFNWVEAGKHHRQWQSQLNRFRTIWQMYSCSSLKNAFWLIPHFVGQFILLLFKIFLQDI